MTKEALVLLPGMMCDKRLFSPQIDALQQDFEIHSPSLNAPSIEDMAQHALHSVGANTINVAGLSLGGIVAIMMAHLAPNRVRRLALLDTNHLPDAPERFEMRNAQIEKVKSGKLRDVIVEEMKPNYFAERNRNNQALRDLLIDMAMELGEDVFINQSMALRDRPDQTESLKNFEERALIMCGEEDKLCPPERHAQMAELLVNRELEFIPYAGHITTLENPSAVNQALEAWLKWSA